MLYDEPTHITFFSDESPSTSYAKAVLAETRRDLHCAFENGCFGFRDGAWDALAASPRVRLMTFKSCSLGRRMFEALAACARGGRLEELQLHNCRFVEADFVRSAADLTRIRVLTVDACATLRDAGAAALGAALPGAPIEVLCITDGNLGDEGTTALAAGLVRNRSLAELALGSGRIGPAGVAALGAALRTGHPLHALEVGYSEAGVGVVAARALALALADNPPLEVLHAHNAAAVAHDGEALEYAAALPENCHLRDLSWYPESVYYQRERPSGVSPEIEDVFREQVTRNFSLRMVRALDNEPRLARELACRYREGRIRCLVRSRCLVQKGRGVSGATARAFGWLLARAPLWVLAHLCGMVI